MATRKRKKRVSRETEYEIRVINKGLRMGIYREQQLIFRMMVTSVRLAVVTSSALCWNHPPFLQT